MIAVPHAADVAPASAGGVPACQYCATPLTISWVDLGLQPLANSYAPTAEAAASLPRYPLHARACPSCWLVQVDRVTSAGDIFSDYAYFSSYSQSWLDHCRRYSEAMIHRFELDADSLVIEVASNDGYLLKHFVDQGVSVLGIDPAANVAEVARAAGIPTETEFFGAEFAKKLVARGQGADHLSAKNVLAHVPEIGDFVQGVAILLKPEAVFTVEFPHLLATMRQLQFDQIYHEHYTYLSLVALRRIFTENGLRIFDVEALETHGGSLRVFVCHQDASHAETGAVATMIEEEVAAGLTTAQAYADYGARVAGVRDDFLRFIAGARAAGKTVAGYGAAAKGNTFLNYCEAGPDTLAFVADLNPAKAGKFMPGNAIRIVSPDEIDVVQPDYLMILPWNLRAEVTEQLSRIGGWGGRFVTAIPELRII